MIRRKAKAALAILALGTLALNLVAGCGTQSVSGQPVDVSTIKVAMTAKPIGDTYLGTVAPYVQTTIAPAISGILDTVNVRVGDKIEPGQVLATLNMDQLNAQKQQAESQLAVAEAQKESSQKQTDNSMQNALAALKTAEAGLASAQTAAQNSVAQAQKALDTAKQDYENTVTAYNSAVAQAQKALAAAEAQLDKARTATANGVAQAQSAVEAARAQLEATKAKLATAIQVDQDNVARAKDAMDTALIALNTARQRAHSENDPALLKAQADYDTASIAYQQALGKLNADQADQSVAVAQAAYDQAVTALQNAQSGKDVQVAQAAVDQAKQALVTAQDTKVVDVKKAAVAQAEQALLSAQSSGQSAVNSARAQVAQAQTAFQTLLNNPALVVNDAQIQAAQAAIQVVQANIDKGRITAPIGGYVVAVNAQVGQAVGPQGGFIVVSSMEPLMVSVAVPEASIAQVKVGMDMDVYVPATGETLQGKVSAIHQALDSANTAVDNGNTNYPIDIEISQPGQNPQSLISGMRVEAHAVDRSQTAILLPANAVMNVQNGTGYVYLVKGGVAKRQQVKVGGTAYSKSLNGTRYEIISGLNPGDEVVVQGQNRLDDGVKVRVVPMKNNLTSSGATGGTNPTGEVTQAAKANQAPQTNQASRANKDSSNQHNSNQFSSSNQPGSNQSN